MYLRERVNLNKLSFILALIITSLILNFGTSILFSSISEKKADIGNPLTLQPTELVKYNASDSYRMQKIANITDSIQNTTEIRIELPPTDWNITRIDFEFNNISTNQEIVTIEDLGDGFRGLDNDKIEGLAMQLRITELTEIYSVDIFGYKYEASSNPGIIYFKITGWDSGNNKPITPVYGTPVELNISGVPQWYTQTFPEPIELTPGDYGLVINGSNIKDNDYYYWWINNSKSGSDLYMCKYTYRWWSWDWRDPEYEHVFLHRINKGVNKPYLPSEINLTVNIDGKEYPIVDGAVKGEGHLTIENVNFKLESVLLDIPISNNESLNLNFNLNYSINIHNQVSFDSTVEIGDVLMNKWHLNPELENCSCDWYCYCINIPDSWNNLQIFKDGLNVSSDINVVFQNQSLTILCDLITEGANWEIYAESLPKSFTINLSGYEFQPAQDIEIEVEPPYIGGKLGLVIQDAQGRIIHLNEKTVLSSTEVFNYLIRSDAIDGIWKAYVYWFNSTDAGFNSITFEVNVPVVIPPPNPLLITLLISLGGAITGSMYGTYLVYKLRKSKKEQKRQQLIQKSKDLINLEYIIVTDKISSLDLFSQSFKKKTLNLTLVSGFLDAIRSFGIEITGSSEQSQVIKLEYQDSKIIMSEYKQFRLIFIMKETPSNEFLETLRLTTIETDEKFGRFLENFDGDLEPFKYVERLLMQRLKTSFLYPLKMLEMPNIKLNTLEKDLIMRVKKYLKSTTSTRFSVLDFIDKDAINPLEVKVFIDLIEKRIFQPIIENTTISYK
jgi:hypothetical protein